jgi:hypothetical protein
MANVSRRIRRRARRIHDDDVFEAGDVDPKVWARAILANPALSAEDKAVGVAIAYLLDTQGGEVTVGDVFDALGVEP